MKDTIKEIIVPGRSKQFNENLVREYLQKYVLFILYGKKYLRELVFTGGTALRVIHGLKRFSEDLDFSLYKKAKEYDFVKLLNALERELELSGYTVVVTYNDKKQFIIPFSNFPTYFMI